MILTIISGFDEGQQRLRRLERQRHEVGADLLELVVVHSEVPAEVHQLHDRRVTLRRRGDHLRAVPVVLGGRGTDGPLCNYTSFY